MAQFSLRQTLANTAPGLPTGFNPSNGIRSLFPPGQASSITLLSNCHFLYTSSLHAVGVTCPFTIDIWGSGKYHFFGTANNGDVLDANYAMGFAFGFSPGGTSHGDIANGTAGAEGSDHFDHPQAFASGVSTDLKVSENPLQLIMDLLNFIVFVGVIIFISLGGHVEYHRNNGG